MARDEAKAAKGRPPGTKLLTDTERIEMLD